MVRAHAGLFVLLLSLLLLVPNTGAAIATVGLGTADSFAVLAGSGITNTGSTTIVGDVGSHPDDAQTGFDSVLITGTNHHNDAVTAGAKADLVTAYNDAAGRPGGAAVGALGAGQTLFPGVYTDNNDPDSMAVGGTLFLDGLGDPASVFIFQSGSTLNFASNANVQLTNGTQACNVFWQVGSSATVNTGAHVEGTILALTSISLLTGATVNGRVLARNGAVTMDTNTITRDPCDAITTSSSSSSTTSTGTGSNTETGTSTGTGTTTGSGTDTGTSTGSGSDTGTNTQTGTGSQTGTLTDTSTTTSSTPTTEIPFFPTWAAMALAATVGFGGAFLAIRRRLK